MHIVSYICCTLFLAQHPTNTKVCEGSNAVLSCVIFDNSTNNAANTTSWFTGNPPVAVSDNMINNTRDGDVVTSILTIESVSLNDNDNGYFCFPTVGIMSNAGVIAVAGEYEHLHVFMYLYVATYIYHVNYNNNSLYLEPNCQAAHKQIYKNNLKIMNLKRGIEIDHCHKNKETRWKLCTCQHYLIYLMVS